MTEPPPPVRRSLRFDDLWEVLNDAQSMASHDHRILGQWTLAQICRHLADSIHGSIDGLDLSRHRYKRWFLSKRMLAWTFQNGIPPGVTVDPNITPPPEVELSGALADLQRAIDRYQFHRGRLKAHPLFGRLDRSTWDRLHGVHCAHHLSFIVPSAQR